MKSPKSAKLQTIKINKIQSSSYKKDDRYTFCIHLEINVTTSFFMDKLSKKTHKILSISNEIKIFATYL
jgi:hypothetical protein